MKLTPEDLQKLQTKQLANIIRKLGEGKTITAREQQMLDDARASESGVRAHTSPNYVRSWDDLAQELGVSRKSLQNWRNREDLREKEDYPRPRADGRHDVDAWRAFMIAHGLKRADEDVDPDEVPGERRSIRDWKEHREKLMCVKLERDIARDDNLLLVATDLEVPIGATLVAFQTKLTQFPDRIARFMVMRRDEADARAKLRDEVDALLTDLNLADYIDTNVDAIAEEFPFNDECAELYARVSFAGQDRAALVELVRLSTLEALRRIGRGAVRQEPSASETPRIEPTPSAHAASGDASGERSSSARGDKSSTRSAASDQKPPRAKRKTVTPRRKRGQ